MIPLNAKPGFTLVEVTLALVLVVLSIGPIMDLQTGAARRVVTTADDVDRMLTAYDFLVLHMAQEEKRVQRTVAEPDMQMTYEQQELPKSSPLLKEFNHLVLETVTWHWQGQRGGRNDRLACIRFVPPAPQSTQEPAAQSSEKKESQPKEPAKPSPGADKKVPPQPTPGGKK